MGYYKDGNKRNIRQFLAPGIVGLSAGALIFGGIVPGLTQTEAQGNTEVYEETQTEGVSTVVTNDVTETVEATSDAIVGITNIQSGSENPFAVPTSQKEQPAGSGSGVIYKSEGEKAFIVTNNHVIEEAEEVLVTLADGTELEAEILGGDVWTDLAVLEVDNEEIETIADFGDSSVLKPGEPVIAIGNPLGLQFSGSVTTGVISGTERLIPVDVNQDGVEDWQSEVLQTDAAINPGNSGGALINAEGKVIGINSMKIAQDAVEGIGLAIPANSALPIIEDLEEKGTVDRPSMGVTLLDVAEIAPQYRASQLQLPEEMEEGVVVNTVLEGSGAADVLESLDVITEIDGESIASVLELRQYLYTEKEAGETIDLTILRTGEEQQVEVELSEAGY
ncbi:S1C family serine protease [Alkalicoccus daliensis]|uniref:Serine protease Do n=1 Tax=Alkalicoccus daliensis TaxID=745820 RepID=A0A1G9ZDD3_9BACI|nr:trypsin-like peptidase domain-containing protein [Alkalicoccus daliensis]SDN19137.1 serine protease Do [Alkalicoccus daliensis]